MAERIFVTGAAGLIGRHLVKRLVREGHEVICFDLGEQLARNGDYFQALEATGSVRLEAGTILDRTGAAVAMAGADAVFHLAAMLGVRRTEENRLRCLEINFQGTDNILDACVRNRVGRVIVASSSEIYGEPTHNPVSETDEAKGKTVYAISKLGAEELTKGYGQLYPWLKYTITRFFNTYGEGQVAQFVVVKFVKRVLEGKNPVVYGDGTQRRSYCHADDIAEGLLAILRSKKAHNKTYNLGNSNEIASLRELAQKVIDVLAPDSDLTVEVNGDFEGTDRSASREVYSRYCDTSLVREDLGFRPGITLEDGIRRIAESDVIHDRWPLDGKY